MPAFKRIPIIGPLLAKFMGPTRPAVELPRHIESGPVLDGLTSAPTVAQAFPNVQHLAVNLSVRGPDHEIEPTMNGRSFGPESIACFDFRCKNIECVEGGFSIQDEITDAIKTNQADLTGRQVCQGWRNKERVGQHRCYFELNYKINIKYKS